MVVNFPGYKCTESPGIAFDPPNAPNVREPVPLCAFRGALPVATTTSECARIPQWQQAAWASRLNRCITQSLFAAVGGWYGGWLIVRLCCATPGGLVTPKKLVFLGVCGSKNYLVLQF